MMDFTSTYSRNIMSFQELIVDNFAGGGGASTGIAMAAGREIDIAINHNAEALAMHAKNHPGTRHYCESVFDVDPIEATGGHRMGLCWLSPDCTHHSKAKGGKPRDQGIRGLAWIALRWAVSVRPRIIMLENVGEFAKWGPLDESGRPVKAKAGETFRAFTQALSTGMKADDPAIEEIRATLGETFPIQLVLNGLGYHVEYRELRACDYGAPTIRKRLFLIARCDGEPIVWPSPTHGDPKSPEVRSGSLPSWRTAAECIDFAIPTKSIFARKKPLAENTLKRIAKGLRRYVLNGAYPFIVDCAHSEESPNGVKRWGDGIRGTDSPLQTVLASGNGSGIVQPFIAKFRADSAGTSLQEPLPTITAGGNAVRPAGSSHALGLVEAALSVPTLIEVGYGERLGQSPRAPGLGQPLGTVVAGGGKHALVAAGLTTYYGDKSQQGDERGDSLGQPIPTQTAENHFGLVAAHLVGIDNQGSGDSSAWNLHEAARSITAEHRMALVTASAMVTQRHTGNATDRSLAQPLGTLTGSREQSLDVAAMAKFRKGSAGSGLTAPLDTICADGLHHGMLVAHMEQANGGGYPGTGRSVAEPMSTILGTGSHQQLVTTAVEPSVDYIPNETFSRLDAVRAFARKYLGQDRLLTTISGVQYEVSDIGLRMLQPRELFKAQGFPDGYIIEFAKRDGKPLSASAQVRMCGNSVCPPVAQALVRANLAIPKQGMALAA